jgi:hypothetical protein
MMFSMSRILLILLLALILPVQGFAAAFAPLHRAMHPDAASSMPCHEQAGHHSSGTMDHSSTGSQQQDSDLAPDACCHQVMNAAPAAPVPSGARKFSDVSRVVLPLATLYIPDSPDRPPRG